MGGAKAHYDGIVAFSQTDFTEDLKKITVPVLVMHSEDDQIVPYADAGPLSAKLLKNGTLKTYKGFPHGMPTTQAETINADLLGVHRELRGRAELENGSEGAMEISKQTFLSRRGFCLCCVGGAATAAAGGWLTPARPLRRRAASSA